MAFRFKPNDEVCLKTARGQRFIVERSTLRNREDIGEVNLIWVDCARYDVVSDGNKHVGTYLEDKLDFFRSPDLG